MSGKELPALFQGKAAKVTEPKAQELPAAASRGKENEKREQKTTIQRQEK